MMSTALSGDLNTAFAVLHQSGLNEDQKAKIAGILKEPRPDNKEQSIAGMQQRIIEVIGGENIASTTASSQATHETPPERRCVSFADAPTSPFGKA